MARGPDRVLSPDVSYVSRDTLAAPPRDHFIEGAPELAVEIRSPTDPWISVIEKGGIWIGHGARVVWCIDPTAAEVVVMRPGERPEERARGERASFRPVLDLELEVDSLFEGLTA